jgi:hypothetical protein
MCHVERFDFVAFQLAKTANAELLNSTGEKSRSRANRQPPLSPQPDGLRQRGPGTKSWTMAARRYLEHQLVSWLLLGLGLLLLLVSPLVGALPGPGGIIVAGIGLALVLRASTWAKRRYVKFKRRNPKAGRWTDWALRRPTARRRERDRKAMRTASGN